MYVYVSSATRLGRVPQHCRSRGHNEGGRGPTTPVIVRRSFRSRPGHSSETGRPAHTVYPCSPVGISTLNCLNCIYWKYGSSATCFHCPHGVLHLDQIWPRTRVVSRRCGRPATEAYCPFVGFKGRWYLAGRHTLQSQVGKPSPACVEGINR